MKNVGNQIHQSFRRALIASKIFWDNKSAVVFLECQTKVSVFGRNEVWRWRASDRTDDCRVGSSTLEFAGNDATLDRLRITGARKSLLLFRPFDVALRSLYSPSIPASGSQMSRTRRNKMVWRVEWFLEEVLYCWHIITHTYTSTVYIRIFNS